jgi:galactose mutarotase-like enzyme
MGDRVGDASLSWVPKLGGKVTSLRFGTGGREWLAPPVRALAVPAPGQDWGELDCSGWDECFPNIGASAALGLSDHGDVWRVPWDVATTSSGSVAPPHRTYRFSRDIAEQGSALRIEYRVENTGEQPLHWAWAQHMLLAADEHTRIVASSPMHLRLDSGFELGVASTRLDWLDGIGTAEIRLDEAVDRAAKLWFEPPLPAVVAVVSDGEWLAWRVADSSFPHLGLWVNLGGWGDAPLRHVAIEPAFGAHDKPGCAYSYLDRLPAGHTKTWHVALEAGRGRPH